MFLRAEPDRRRLGVRPVALDPDPARIHDQAMSRGQLRDAGERRSRTRHETEREVGLDRFVVEVGLYEAAREQALELRREDEEVAADGGIERLDAQAVSGQAWEAH